MKLHMALYTLALVFIRGLIEILLGNDSISLLMLVQMLLTAMSVAIIESICLPEKLDECKLKQRTILWAIMCNLLFIGASVCFHWFNDIPTWGVILLIIFLEGGLFAMWFGVHVVQKMDTRDLNMHLKQFQEE